VVNDEDGGIASAGSFTIVRRDPGPNERGVPTSTAIEAELSDDVAPDTVGPSDIRLLDPQSMSLQGKVTLEGRTVVFRPSLPLEYGTQYAVELGDSLGGLSSIHGRSLTDQDPARRWSFTTANYPTVIALPGRVAALRYDATSNHAVGLDPANRRLIEISLDDRTTKSHPLPYQPDDLCLPDISTAYVVNRDVRSITGVDLRSDQVIANVDWSMSTPISAERHVHIRCTTERILLVDAAWAPGLWELALLGTPVFTDHSSTVQGIGDLIWSSTGNAFYFWYQYGWGAGLTSSRVQKVDSTSFATLDMTDATNIQRDPTDAPMFLDASGSILVTKNFVLNAANLKQVKLMLPAGEEIYAADFEHGRIASRNAIYAIDSGAKLADTATHLSTSMFFDKAGALYFGIDSQTALYVQTLPK
jgi:hypothetical protein